MAVRIDFPSRMYLPSGPKQLHGCTSLFSFCTFGLFGFHEYKALSRWKEKQSFFGYGSRPYSQRANCKRAVALGDYSTQHCAELLSLIKVGIKLRLGARTSPCLSQQKVASKSSWERIICSLSGFIHSSINLILKACLRSGLPFTWFQLFRVVHQFKSDLTKILKQMAHGCQF